MDEEHNTAGVNNRTTQTLVPPNPSKVPVRQTMKEVKRAKARARYAKRNPIAKRSRKYSNPQQAMNCGPSSFDQGGTISSSMDKRKRSTCQQDYVESSQAGKMMRHSIPDLPEDIWRHIHSLVPLRDAARASCVSRAFLLSWRCRPKLILNRDTLRSKAHVSGANFSYTIDCILRRHSGVGVKTLQLVLDDIANNENLDSWLQLVVAPGIEELTLMPISKTIKYNFPCSLLSEEIRNSIRHLALGFCAFRPTPELGHLRCLTSLCLDTVDITGYELECFFSHSRALERLVLFDCYEIICLTIPCELEQLSSLRVCGCWKLKVIESKAPNLSNLAITGKVKLSGETLQMKHLSLFFGNVVCYARSELPSIMSNLETLYLTSDAEDIHTPMLPTKFMHLKHLTISITSGLTFSPSYDYFSLVSFLDASPSLETLVLDVTQQHMKHASVFGDSSSLRQIDERHYCCLKSVKITGFSSAKSLVELTCHVLKSAFSLQSLTLDTLYGWRCSEENHASCCPMGKGILSEAPRALEAIRRYIKDKVPTTTKFSVMEPCSRCHKVRKGRWYSTYRN